MLQSTVTASVTPIMNLVIDHWTTVYRFYAKLRLKSQTGSDAKCVNNESPSSMLVIASGEACICENFVLCQPVTSPTMESLKVGEQCSPHCFKNNQPKKG